MQLQGAEDKLVDSISKAELDAALLKPKELALLEMVKVWTHHAYKTTTEDIERLRKIGWTDPQIAEAVYITAMFAFFNRVADAFGLPDPGYLQIGVRGRGSGVSKRRKKKKELKSSKIEAERLED